MNWNKIAVASAAGSAFGLAEYDKQRKREQKKREIEYRLRIMRPGEKLRFSTTEVEFTDSKTFVVNGYSEFRSIYDTADRIMMFNGDNW